MKMLIKTKIASLVVLSFVMMNVVSLLPNYNQQEEINQTTQNSEINLLDEIPTNIQPAVTNLLQEESGNYSSNIDIGTVLGDRENEYTEIFEPWKSQAAIHAVTYHEETGYLALAGGYLYDNEIHLFRLNTITGDFDKVWDCGDGIIQSDVMAIAFGDTDLNDFLEIVAGSSDGHVYVFEQRHIYDPITNTENMFDLVWTSPSMFRVFDVKIEDADRDFRPDIIVGSWDGVFLFEYDDHSGYPFNEEHWISYRQVYHNDVNGEKIYSLESGDTNHNGLPEIVVGTREGTVYVFENDGISMYINGEYFPLIQDNAYELVWTSENYTWTPILSMDIGELDGSEGDELTLIAQGQGIFTLDWNEFTRTYDYKKVVRAYEDWETFGYWGLDHYVDRVVSANNVTYHDPLNSSINVPEPIVYTGNGPFIPDADCYPYNTGMSMATDGNFTTFDASITNVTNATAVVDFGLDEEGTGSANDLYDVKITFSAGLTTALYSDFNFSISQDGNDFEQVFSDHFTIAGNQLRVDIDDALIDRKWDWFRYAKISVFNNASYDINSLELSQVYNLLTDALSLTIGPLRLDGEAFVNGEEEPNKIVAGTVTGKYLGIQWNDEDFIYELVYDSGDDDFFAEGSGIWSIENIHTTTDVPTLIKKLSTSFNIGSDVFNSWSFGKLDPLNNYYDSNYFVGTNQGSVAVFDMEGDVDSTVQNTYFLPIQEYLDDIRVYEPNIKVAIETAHIEQFNDYPIVAVSTYNPDRLPTSNDYALPTGTLSFFFRETPSSTAPFVGEFSIEDLDLTGEIASLIGVSKTTPKIDFYDVDEDGDLDMIFSNGQLYLAKNLYVEREELKFVICRDYFKEINDELKGNGWGQPDIWDMNEDGKFDIILNYVDKAGTTAFLNQGTQVEPEWLQEKRIFSNTRPETNLRFNNYTDLRIIPTGTGSSFDYEAIYNPDFTADQPFSAVSYSINDDDLIWFEPNYNAVDTYMVATYPKVCRKEFSLTYGETSFSNFGFHIHESWNNDEDLSGWTLAIKSGDIDGDGKGEIIVGDYDNNVYVFENLLNNTYKRMYQTPDLVYNETTDESPYLYQELEGISGEFVRTVWDHAEHLLVDVDLDQDGLKEMIVCSDLQIYIFEDKGLTGGDELQLVYTIDLRTNPFNGSEAWMSKAEKITAIDSAADMDNNGELELLLAVGPFLFVFNVPTNNFLGIEDEDYFLTSPKLDGRYNLRGNPMANTEYIYSIINTIISGDTDKDGLLEIILGGINDTRTMRNDGFLNIYECQGGTFNQVWEAPESVTTWNPINVVKIDDQDYDLNQEIIIGHSEGIDIWEHIQGTNSEYQKVEHITSSPNYPIISVNQKNSTGDMWILGLQKVQVDWGRSLSDMANCPSSNEIIQVFDDEGDIRWKSFDKATELWSLSREVNLDKTYGDTTGSTYYSETEPSILGTSNGNYLISWVTHYSDNTHQIWISEYTGSGWGTPTSLTTKGNSDLVQIGKPQLFEVSPTNVGVLITYNSSIEHSLYSSIFNYQTSTWVRAWSRFEFNGWDNFQIHSISATNLPDGSYAFAMAAINYGITKPDFDIWVLTVNSTFSLEAISKESPRQATTSYGIELYPDIDYDRSRDDALMIIYENIDAAYEDRIGLVSSKDFGFTWSYENTLNTIPDNLVRIENPSSGYVEWYIYPTSLQAAYISEGYVSPLAYSPSLACMDDGGFIYEYLWTVKEAQGPYVAFGEFGGYYWFGYPMYGINHESDWVDHTLRNIIDLDVGDTDSDGRREIVAGWEDQVGSYELKSSNDGFGNMTYQEVWLSDILDNPFTGVTVFDSNGNGFEEIAYSCERGDVVVIDYRDPSEGASKLAFPSEQWSTPMGDWGSNLLMETYDLDGDMNDEIIVGGLLTGSIYALDDDGSKLWNFTAPTSIGRDIQLVDLTADSTPEVLSINYDGNLYVLDIKTGTKLWSYASLGTGIFTSLRTGDIDLDGDIEIILGAHNGTLIILDHGGHYLNQTQACSGAIPSIAIGTNYLDNSTFIAISDDTDEQIHLIHSHNLTEFYVSENDMCDLKLVEIKTFDFDEDGVDEVIFGMEEIHILNILSQEIYYNSTFYGQDLYTLYIEDFDGDGEIEILFHGKQGLYLEDVTSGQTQWKYENHEILEDFYDVEIGHFGGSGMWDVALVTEHGEVVALDGKNGIPMWFDLMNQEIGCVGAVKIDNNDVDSIAIWGSSTSRIHLFESSEMKIGVPILSYIQHETYLDFETGSDSIDNFWLQDLNEDGIDEIAILKESSYLYLWNSEPQSIWNDPYKADGKIYDVQFGDMNDGIGLLDIIVSLSSGELIILNGDTGEVLDTIKPETGYIIRDFAMGNFKNGDYEFVILYEDKTIPEAYLAFYDNKTNLMHKSENSLDEVANYMALGHFSGSSTLDVIVGGKDEELEIFLGTDGTSYKHQNVGEIIYGIKAGYFDGDIYEDFAYFDEYGDIMMIDTDGWTMFYAFDFELDEVREFETVDIYNDDGKAELVVNLVNIGVVAFDTAGNEVWQYNAPLIMEEDEVYMLIGDMGSDSKTDLVLTNHNYLQVVNGTSESIEWNFVGEERVFKPRLGRFTSKDGVSDIVFIADNRIVIISGMEKVPMKGIQYPYGEEISKWYQDIGLFWIPIGITLAIPELILIKKRRKAKQ